MKARRGPHRTMSNATNLFEMATQQFQRAADVVGLSPMVRAILSEPQNEIIVNFPVRMDSGEYRSFKGYRIQHNNANGPYKGGIRYHEAVNLAGVATFAMLDEAESRNCGLRTAALTLALGRLERVYQERGIFP
jgi:hypothetical protein